MIEQFNALILRHFGGVQTAQIERLSRSDLPLGDVLVDIKYSSLNYKDALAVTGKGKIVRAFPMVPGVDFAGTVVETQSPAFAPGDGVVLTGWGVGERHWGGFSQMARVKADWLIKPPSGLTLRHAMMLGTAGLTAMLCVMALERNGVRPDTREILVTGATGGVGSISVQLLSSRGYKVTALTRKAAAKDYLFGLGASKVISPHELESGGKTLVSERWAGVIDCVGGETLSAALAGAGYGTPVVACGLASDSSLHTTLFPFILRGVQLIGVDSVMISNHARLDIWSRLALDTRISSLDAAVRTIGLADIQSCSEQMIAGNSTGRLVVDVNQLQGS